MSFESFYLVPTLKSVLVGLFLVAQGYLLLLCLRLLRRLEKITQPETKKDCIKTLLDCERAFEDFYRNNDASPEKIVKGNQFCEETLEAIVKHIAPNVLIEVESENGDLTQYLVSKFRLPVFFLPVLVTIIV